MKKEGGKPVTLGIKIASPTETLNPQPLKPIRKEGNKPVTLGIDDLGVDGAQNPQKHGDDIFAVL